MSIERAPTDKTPTNSKSQWTDSPSLLALDNYIKLRKLLIPQDYNNIWLENVAEILEVNVSSLNPITNLNEIWQPHWGSIIKEDSKSIAWKRPDFGPLLVDRSNSSETVKVIRFMLRMNLIQLLNENGFSSFEAVQKTPNWNKARVFYDFDEVKKIVFADAITGICIHCTDEKLPDRSGLVEQQLTGHIIIVLANKPQTFF